MPTFRPIGTAISFLTPLCFVGCGGEPETPAERVQAERADVEEVREHLADARENETEQLGELKDAKAEVAAQERELTAAEDREGDLERQLAKEKADLRAAEQAAGPALPAPSR